jgi:hypothetical protein
MIRINTTISQNLSVQLATSVALDAGVEEIYELVKGFETDLEGNKFRKDIRNILLDANRKGFFSGKFSEDHFLRNRKDLLEQSLTVAINRHRGEYRESGYPYLAHALSTGFVLARLGFPAVVALAGMLHDTVEDTPDKNRMLNKLHALSPYIAWYVFSVSGPDIRDAVEKDKQLNAKLQSISGNSGNLYPGAIKVADSIANLFDLESMRGKDGRTATERQKLFITKIKDQVLPFARQIDQENIIPIKKRNEIFSLEEYLLECINHKLSLIESQPT